MALSNGVGGSTRTQVDHAPPAPPTPLSLPTETIAWPQALQYSSDTTFPTTYANDIIPSIVVRQDTNSAYAGERPSNGGQDIPPVQSHNEFHSAGALSFAISVLVHRYATRQYRSDAALRNPMQLPRPSDLRNAAVALLLDALTEMFVHSLQ